MDSKTLEYRVIQVEKKMEKIEGVITKVYIGIISILLTTICNLVVMLV